MSASVLLALLLAATPEVTTAADDNGDGALHRRWALGLQVGAYDLPSGHLGIPIAGTADGTHLSAAIVGRYQLGHFTAVDVGMGLPTSASGPAFWGEFEFFWRLWADQRQVVAFELYGAPGLQLGFAGPDYYARRTNTWVGYEYAFGGSAAFGLRLPLGLRVCWAQNLFDTYLEAAEILALAPSVEGLFSLSVGARIHW
jgi:hypothetical protein